MNKASLPFKRIAIVNRGEPAMRLIRAVRDFNAEHGTELETIAFFTDPDRHAMFVREADATHGLGAASFVDSRDNQRKSSYLDYSRLERALVETRAEAAWVGWGFVAEHAEFAELCDKLGVVFIGPRPDVMRRLGEKIASKLLAEEASVPVAAWSRGPVATLEAARAEAARIGYPLLVKASAGGGGRGIRKVLAEDQLAEAFQSAGSEALKSFGDGTLFLEKMVTGARHVEVQIIADTHGTVWAAGVRDCTIQRRNQKVVEEAPSPVLPPDCDAELRQAAVRLAKAAGYTNAGTAEFLFNPKERQLYFMEMNTRLQVEHPVTELTTGLDLVKLQLIVAGGGRLEGEAPTTVGHAIEVRVNAEDPDNGFAPAPGRVEFLRLPAGAGLRIDTGVSQGDMVPPDFDSMIGKIIAYGHDRREALARLRRALNETAVVIEQGATNKAFLLELLQHPGVVSNEVDTSWLDRAFSQGQKTERPYADLALVQVAIEVYEREFEIEKGRFFASIARGRPMVRTDTGLEVELRCGGQNYKFNVRYHGQQHYRLLVDGRWIDASVYRQNRFERCLTCAGQRYRVICARQGVSYLVEVNGVQHRVSRDEGGVVRAPAPAIVLSTSVKEGDEVAVGDRLVVLEAMKMEMPVLAPCPGKIRQVAVRPNMQVNAGDPILFLEPATEEGPSDVSSRLGFSSLAEPPAVLEETNSDSIPQIFRARCDRLLGDLRRFLLGYDVDPGDVRWVLREHAQLRRGVPYDEESLVRELELMTILVDQLAVHEDQSSAGSAVPGGYFQLYLRSIEKGKDLPSTFLDNLKRLLSHYGVSELERTPELEEALLWIVRANTREETSAEAILKVLEVQTESGPPSRSASYKAILERLIEQTHDRFLALNTLARHIRYLYFDLPIIEQARSEELAHLAEEVNRLPTDPDPQEIERVVTLMAECPYPVLGFMFQWLERANPATQLFLQSYIRRFYRGRSLGNIEIIERGGISYGQVEYISERGGKVGLIATVGDYSQLDKIIDGLLRLMQTPEADQNLADLLLRAESFDAEAMSQQISAKINRANFPHHVNRICVSVVDTRTSEATHLTYRAKEEGFEEVSLYRDLHHMVADRLELWRMRNFNTERIPSAPNTLLLRCTGKDNPRDQRVFALVDAHNLNPLRNDAAGTIEFPHLDWVYAEAIASIREYQHRETGPGLQSNRVYIYSRSPVSLRPDEFEHLVRRLALPTKGLRIEKLVLRAKMMGLGDSPQERAIHISVQGGVPMRVRNDVPSRYPIRTLTPYSQKLAQLRSRGMLYPYEIIRMLTPEREGTSVPFPLGKFVEYDLDEGGRLAPVKRPYGENKSNVVVGVITNFTRKHPEGVARVSILSDPSGDMGALAEPECRRIIAALDLAEHLGLPVEWFPISSGAKISMESGTENLDWTARVLRRLVEFTQAGHEVNVIVTGTNVGAQAYWNAEATMLMHTRGILIMTPPAYMVLTGKRALDYAGSVSAEDNTHIGGVNVIMGPNGQSQYLAPDITRACILLFHHYEHTYVAKGERFPRKGNTRDPIARDVTLSPHRGDGFATLGDIFSDKTNPGRKKPFDIRSVITAVADRDHAPLERWSLMRDAETAVVMDVHLGGYPVCLLGIESKPLPRLGFVPGDGPESWTAGTLFPLSSKKVARTINSASNNRPVVILANLVGFDGSPESLSRLQLEYGAEIGRAVVNFRGPIVFCVLSRYHGGAYVVFSRTLNENLEVAALEGTYASVIGGAPAAAVVFPREVKSRVYSDPRVRELRAKIASAVEQEKPHLLAKLNDLLIQISIEKQVEVAEEFDRIHTVQRAQEVGSLHRILPAKELRPYLIDAVERGIQRVLASETTQRQEVFPASSSTSLPA